MDGEAPRILLRDHDDKFGASFDRVADGVGIRVIKTAVRAPDMNAIRARTNGPGGPLQVRRKSEVRHGVECQGPFVRLHHGVGERG
jgi:hypothetical protein